MMQRHVSVMSAETRQQRSRESAEGYKRIMSESREQEVEPDDIGLMAPDSTQKPGWSFEIIETPATVYGKTLHFGFFSAAIIGQDGETKERVSLKFPCDMKSIFT